MGSQYIKRTKLHGMYSSRSGQRSVKYCCGNCNELYYSIRGEEFLDQLNWYQFEKDSASRIRKKTESK
jgi:hypothetical protein